MASKILLRLGSNSITRAKILRDSKIEFVQTGGNFNEDNIEEINPKSFVYKAAIGKFEELYSIYGIEDMPLLVADTVVTSQGLLLRKAKNEEDARAMLKLQSDNFVEIITYMIYKSKEQLIYDLSSTKYKFGKFDKNHLEEYLKSGEYIGKAGAVMVEGFCKPYIKSVQGYESTAMGLCVEKLRRFIN